MRSLKPTRGQPEGHWWCAKCKSIKPMRDFYGRSTAYCRPCEKATQAERRLRQGIKPRLQIPQETGQRRCAACAYIKPLADFYFSRKKGRRRSAHYTSRCIQCIRALTDKKHNAAQMRQHRIALREKVLDHYGHACACCGTTEGAFLTIDHIDGQGRKHIRGLRQRENVQNGTSITVYGWLVRTRFPPRFRTLCYNCNSAAYRLGSLDLCPHRTSSQVR